jgi:hypothetical protein
MAFVAIIPTRGAEKFPLTLGYQTTLAVNDVAQKPGNKPSAGRFYKLCSPGGYIFAAKQLEARLYKRSV